MKIPFYINLIGLILLATVFVYEPIYGMIGVLPYGILQVGVSIFLVFQDHPKVKSLAGRHIMISIVPFLLLTFINYYLGLVAAVLSISLLFFSFYICFIAMKTTKP